MSFLQKNGKFVLIALLLVFVFVPDLRQMLGLQFFISLAQVQSVSPTTLNGQPAILVSLLVGSGALGQGAIEADIDSERFPNWDSEKALTVIIGKEKDTYSYRLSERNGNTRSVFQYQLSASCTGNNPGDANSCVRRYFGQSFSQFKSTCRQANQDNMAIDTGSAGNPNWLCYSQTSKYIVSDFDRTGGVYAPEVIVQGLKYRKGDQPWIGQGEYEDIFQLTLDNVNRRGALISTEDGSVYGEAVMTSLAATFNTPPSSSGIKAIREADAQNIHYLLVDAQIDQEYQRVVNTFSSCLSQNRRDNQGVTGIAFGPFVVNIGESYNPQAINCFNSLNAGVTNLANLRPTGDFSRAELIDTSSLDSERFFTIQNAFTIPAVTLTLYAEKVGIRRPNAVPESVSCENKQMPGGAQGSLRATIQNGQGAGVLTWSARCEEGVTVVQGSGSLAFEANQQRSFDIPIDSGSNAGTSTCTVEAQSSDLSVRRTASCSVTQSQICNLSPKSGCTINEQCQEVCPVVEGCDKTPHPSCVITPECTEVCEGTGEMQALQCIPFIQKVKTESVGGILGIGGKTVQSCENDILTLLVVVIGVAIVVFLIRPQQRRR